jgi:hypothetical protein
MAIETLYGEDFRSIGQALEAKNIRAFELKRLGDWYIVRGVTEGDGLLRSKVRKFKLRFRRISDPESLILGLSEVQDLSKKGKSKRSRLGRMPDFRRLSNMLRTVGAYLESKQAKLIELKVRPFSITLSYQDNYGRQQLEDRTIRSFYDLFLELHRKRDAAKNRSLLQQSEG